MYKTTFLGILEAEKLQKHKCTLFSETPCSIRDLRDFKGFQGNLSNSK